MTDRSDGPSASDLALGLLAAISVSLASAGALVFLVVGSIVSPRVIGLYVALPYYSYVLLRLQEQKGGAHWPAFSNNFLPVVVLRKFLSLSIVSSKELDEAQGKPGASFVFAVFPHGSWIDYRVLMDGMLFDAFPNLVGKIKTLAATALFRMPVARELALWSGCIDARRWVAEKALDRGDSLIVLPGGETEQIQTESGREKIYCKRKGFVKLAMRKGVPVVPVYVFGVSDYYDNSKFLFSLRVWMVKHLAVCVPLTAGFLGWPLCPKPVKTTIVFGKPLMFTMKEAGNPSAQELDYAHKQFVEALEELFDKHKEALGYGERKLEITL